MSLKILGDWLADKPFSLAMSSGFFGFFAHTGMLRALENAHLAPTSLVGSSAGALVAGLSGSGLTALEIGAQLTVLRRNDFWDPRLGFGLLGGRLFLEKLQELLVVKTFEQCPVPVAMSAYDLIHRKTQVLREGDLATAISASCALPLLFHPVRRDGCLLSDGGIADRTGLAGSPLRQRVFYHHIASKSPWRRAGSPALELPKRSDMVSLRIAKLPRANPFHLERGVEAMREAFECTQRALLLPIEDSVVHIAS